MNTSKDLVSIVVPVYNAGGFLDDTINTVLDQTYTNWELILVNDKSTDHSREIALKYPEKDNRIKLLDNKKNSGAAITRNRGIDEANGRYIAFLDADDLWDKHKLQKQVSFMRQHDCAFSFTGYEFADATGTPNGKKVRVPATITYKQALKNTTISTITVMFNMQKLSKADVYMPHVKSEDTACWWQVLKQTELAYGLNEVLSYYRRTSSTMTSNKLIAIGYIWNLYRNVEKLSIPTSMYNFCGYAIGAVGRRV